ncbi:tumor necrosis factor ligand superfamily member 6 [Trachinotus anak]|uniref:tumor necrosis factor ligand superfamily member 6 n=1 Tax=Trachinotus anak TaxID=443729 RepID=UPI0039F1BBBB
MGVSPCLSMVVLLLFLLVFAALGFEAYQIHKMQTELKQMRQDKPETEFNTAQKQIGRIEKVKFPQTLRWEPKAAQAFVSGGVTYRIEDGGLQVNESGLYHIYSRVELIFKECSPTSSFEHSVFLRRVGHTPPLTLMKAHRAGFCSEQLQHSWTAESYLSSALNLQKYDRVFVNVSRPSFLSHSHYGNFFGLYKV